MHKLIGFGRAGIAMNSFYKAACIAFITAPLAHGQLTMTAQPTSPNSGSMFHCGTDYVILEQGRRAAHATPFGYEFTANVNYGNQFYGYFNDRLIYDLYYVYAFSGSNPYWLTQCSSRSYSSPGQAIGVLDDAVIFKAGAAGYLLRCGPTQSTLFSANASDWLAVRSGEGVGLLEYGPYNSSGFRIISIAGNSVTLGDILVAPEAQWKFAGCAIRRNRITIRQTDQSGVVNRVLYCSRHQGGWAVDRMVRDADFGGAIVGIGDDRVVVRMADTPGQVNLSVFRIDGSNPYLETLVIVPRYFGDADMANAVAYARRGSLLAQFGNGIVYANRSEPCQGDANSNRVVDGSDIGVLLNEWGASSPSTMADFNHDGQVNGADLGLLLSSWGPCPN